MKCKHVKCKNVLELVRVVAIPIVALMVSSNYNTAASERQQATDYVQIASEILSNEPQQHTLELRKWALEVLNNYSEIKMSESLMESLVSKIPLQGFCISCPEGTTRYTFSWSMTGADGYSFELEEKIDGEWVLIRGTTVSETHVTLDVPIRQNLRWRAYPSDATLIPQWIRIEFQN